ncbi:MAG: PorT family protein [Bacteroidota bacterium]|nr:PorT family protein [Bacteroidota bacterium]
MRKSIYGCILSALLLVSGFYSETIIAQSRFQAGPYFGTGIRLLSGNDKADIGFGYRFGVITRVPITKQFSVTPTFTYARKGYNKLEFLILEDEEFYRQRLSYLDIFLPLKFQVGEVFTFQVGMQAGFLLDAEFSYKTYGDDRQKVNIKNDLHSLDLGFIAGAGFQFMNGVGLEFIINPGLNNIYDKTPPLYYDSDMNDFFGEEFNGKNLMATINLYYLFGYKAKTAD